MRVIHACTEFFPFIKTGGLADVTGALPHALQEQGIEVRMLMPGFPALLANVSDLKKVADCQTFAGSIQILLGHYQNLPIYLIDAPHLYHRPGNPYLNDKMLDYSDNYLRFALLGWVSCELAKGLDKRWRPDIIHSHDWHAGLAGAYLALNNYPARSLFTIHNLAYQGLFAHQYLANIGLPESLFQTQGLEFYQQISYLKAGIFYADHVTTVSPTYANEICQSEFGTGLEGLLQEKRNQHKLTGILNGIDDTIWDPRADHYIAYPYHAKNLVNRRKNKAKLQADCQLEVNDSKLLCGAVSRLTSQKGLDLLLSEIPNLLTQGGQLVLLGSGDQQLEQAFKQLAQRYPQQVSVSLHYDEPFAHQIMAGADVILVPSRFEPCGLTQLYALQYGALPLVRETGGLADTVLDCSLENMADEIASGFVFQHPTSSALKRAIRRAFVLWQQPKLWQKIQRRNMQNSRSWQHSATEYATLYQHILANK